MFELHSADLTYPCAWFYIFSPETKCFQLRPIRPEAKDRKRTSGTWVRYFLPFGQAGRSGERIWERGRLAAKVLSARSDSPNSTIRPVTINSDDERDMPSINLWIVTLLTLSYNLCREAQNIDEIFCSPDYWLNPPRHLQRQAPNIVSDADGKDEKQDDVVMAPTAKMIVHTL